LIARVFVQFLSIFTRYSLWPRRRKRQIFRSKYIVPYTLKLQSNKMIVKNYSYFRSFLRAYLMGFRHF